MSQATSVNMEQETTEHRSISLPIDGIIKTVATRVGGSKAKEVERFLKFAMVGVLGAIIDLGVSNLLWATVIPPVGEWLWLKNVSVATLSFSAAVTSNFIWNRYWTYPDSRSIPLLKQMGQFAFVCTIGWIGRTIWILLATASLSNLVANVLTSIGSDLATSERVVNQLGGTLAILIGIFVVMIWNFLVNRYWTYSDVD